MSDHDTRKEPARGQAAQAVQQDTLFPQRAHEVDALKKGAPALNGTKGRASRDPHRIARKRKEIWRGR